MSTPFLSKRYTLKFCTQVHVYPETWPPRRLFSVFSAEYIWSYFLRILFTYTCLNVSRKSVESLTTLGVAHAGRHASFFAVFGCVDDKFSRTYRSRLPQNINVWRTSMATGQVAVQFCQSWYNRRRDLFLQYARWQRPLDDCRCRSYSSVVHWRGNK